MQGTALHECANTGNMDGLTLLLQKVSAPSTSVQGYLAHKKTPPPRTLQ